MKQNKVQVSMKQNKVSSLFFDYFSKNSHFKIIPDTTTFAWKQKIYRQD